MKICAIIPCRGGSKGLPGKNIRLLDGKPLLAHTLEAAEKSSLLNEIFVSTDSPEISDVALSHGAKVIKRPPELATDASSSEEALLHGLDHIAGKDGSDPDIVVLLQCTSPFTTTEDIDGTIAKLLYEGADSALSVASFSHFLWKKGPDGGQGINHDGRTRARRQDMEPQFLETGSVYAMKCVPFRAEKTRFCGKTVLYECSDPHRCHEIDDAADFYKAEAISPWFKLSEKEKSNYVNGNIDLGQRLPNGLGALVSDFDGVFTDNKVITAQDGGEAVVCDRGDGAGIAELKRAGLKIAVLSAERNPVVAARCAKLGIESLQGVEDKPAFLEKWLKANRLEWEQIIYLGNDEKDRECLLRAGVGVIPADAHMAAKIPGAIIGSEKGGSGFVRETADLILDAVASGELRILSTNPSETCYLNGQRDERAWGFWEVLSCDDLYCVKKIHVRPGGALSLQYHNHREELWKIIEGKGVVILDDNKYERAKGDIIRINRKQTHRIINDGREPLVFIEVQTGDELREDDIVRLADIYNRI